MDARGFTLVELIVVIAVMVLMLAAVPVLMSGGWTGVSLNASARSVADALRQARSEAVMSSRDVAFRLDPTKAQFVLEPGNADARLVGDVELSLDPEGVTAIVFHPDGSSSGGTVIVRNDQESRHVSVDWITGNISIGE